MTAAGAHRLGGAGQRVGISIPPPSTPLSAALGGVLFYLLIYLLFIVLYCIALFASLPRDQGQERGERRGSARGEGGNFAVGEGGETLISTNPGAFVCGVLGAAEGCGAPRNSLMRASSFLPREGRGGRVPVGEAEEPGAG